MSTSFPPNFPYDNYGRGLVEEQAAPVVRGVFKSKLRVSLNPSDGREENQDALELFGDVCADLVGELRALRDDGGRSVANFRAYVAGVAFNACYRHLRRKYPQRHSLKTRVRYLLTHHDAFALWEANGHEHLCGPAAWRGRRHVRGRTTATGALKTPRRGRAASTTFRGVDARLRNRAESSGVGRPCERGRGADGSLRT